MNRMDRMVQVHEGASSRGRRCEDRPAATRQVLPNSPLLLGACLLLVSALTAPTRGSRYDGFSDNRANPVLWTVSQAGYGPTVSESNQTLEIYLPADSAEYGGAGAFWGGYVSACWLVGDFDIQVDYELLAWPHSNGARIGLLLEPELGGGAGRVSFGTDADFYGWPREVYLTSYYGDYVQATPTDDTSGTLRVVRSGNTVTGYYFSSGTWLAINSFSPTTTGAVRFILQAWSHDFCWTGQDVRVAFDNVILNSGHLVWANQPLDDFDDSQINPFLWHTYQTGSGPTVSESNQRLEIGLPGESEDDPRWSPGAFRAGYVSTWWLRGDFDIQVDYELLAWPHSNGARIGLLLEPELGGGADRVSFGTDADFYGWPREVYLTSYYGDYVQATPTDDTSGTLRVVRSGNTVTGYYFSSGTWLAINSFSPTTTEDVSMLLQAWSHGLVWTGQDVRVAFDNVILNWGQLVFDDQPPIADAGPDQTVEATSPAGALVQIDGSGSVDADGEALTYSWDTDADGLFDDAAGAVLELQLGIGEHQIALQVTDDGGLSGSDEVTVVVVDTTPPVIDSLTASPNTLVPPNRKLVLVAVAAEAHDLVDPSPISSILDVVCNEPITAADYRIEGMTAELRAERLGKGSGRVYTLRVQCLDASGNPAFGTVTVTVPRNRGRD